MSQCALTWFRYIIERMHERKLTERTHTRGRCIGSEGEVDPEGDWLKVLRSLSSRTYRRVNGELKLELSGK